MEAHAFMDWKIMSFIQLFLICMLMWEIDRWCSRFAVIILLGLYKMSEYKVSRSADELETMLNQTVAQMM